MDLKNKKVLVTGADGFIGSHLTETLVRLGCDVRAFVFYNSFNSWGWLDHSEKDITNNLDVFAGDIRDPNGVRNAVKGCDAIFHLASLIAIPYSYHSPDAYIDTNVKGTLNIVQAARDYEIEHTICTSTSEVYGSAQFVPITEEHPLHAQSPYSASKISADAIATSFHRSFEMPISILRPFNTFGPRQSARAVIPNIIAQIAAGEPSLKLGSLDPTRDFTYVQDTADGFVQMAQKKAGIGDVTNIGSGHEISIGDLAELIAKLMNSDIKIEQDEQRIRPEASEVDRLLADTQKAQTTLDWAPKHASEDGFAQGLEKTIEWFQNPNNLKLYKTHRYNI